MCLKKTLQCTVTTIKETWHKFYFHILFYFCVFYKNYPRVCWQTNYFCWQVHKHTLLPVTHYSCQISMKTVFYWQIFFFKYSHIKFHENLFHGSQLIKYIQVVDGWRDTKNLIVAFWKFVDVPQSICQESGNNDARNMLSRA
jgi:hypothetical protein